MSAPASRAAGSFFDRFRAIPWQIQSLVAGILLLVGVGLYRRYSEPTAVTDSTQAQTSESDAAPSAALETPTPTIASAPPVVAATALPDQPTSNRAPLQGDPAEKAGGSKSPAVQAPTRGQNPKGSKGQATPNSVSAPVPAAPVPETGVAEGAPVGPTAIEVTTPKTQPDPPAKARVASPDNPY